MIDEIKAIPIAGYLDSKGIQPNRVRGKCLFYRAFWRGGDNPTNVKVETEKNVWYDYGAGEGGSIIDLVSRVENISISEAIHRLQNENFGDYVAPTFHKEEHTETGIVVVEVKELFYYPLKAYMLERGISENISRKYCKEIRYKYGENGKECFAIAFPNISGGYVIRNRQVKNCTAQDISLVSVPGSTAYMVFEGFMDFLSYVELYGSPKINAIILNSVTNIKRAYPYFDKAEHIYLLLDNDEKGREEAQKLVSLYGSKVTDKSSHYAPYKDFNEYLMKGGKNGEV